MIQEMLTKLNGGQLIGLVAVLGGALIAAVAIIASQWRRVRIAELEATLKQQMLDKGMSAGEIEQVLKVGQDSPSATGNQSIDRAMLAQQMVEQGYEGEDIERVLRAYQPSSSPGEAKQVANHS